MAKYFRYSGPGTSGRMITIGGVDFPCDGGPGGAYSIPACLAETFESVFAAELKSGSIRRSEFEGSDTAPVMQTPAPQVVRYIPAPDAPPEDFSEPLPEVPEDAYPPDPPPCPDTEPVKRSHKAKKET